MIFPKIRSNQLTGVLEYGDDATIIHKATVTLIDAQIKALPTTAVELVADLAVGQIPLVISGIVQIDTAGGAYENIDDQDSFVAISYAKNGVLLNDAAYIGINAAVAGLLGVVATGFVLFPPRARFNDVYATPEGTPTFNPIADFSGCGLSIGVFNSLGDFTGGNAANMLKATVYYAIVEL